MNKEKEEKKYFESKYANSGVEKVKYDNSDEGTLKYKNSDQPGKYENPQEKLLQDQEEKRSEEKSLIKDFRGSLVKEKLIKSSDGKSSFLIRPLLTSKDAQIIEESFGIILAREGEKIFSFLGKGSFGEFYIGQNQQDNSFWGIKLITERLSSCFFEAEIQQKLSSKVDRKQSHLMPLEDVIKESEECLVLVMPLASLGDVNKLIEKLKLEKDKEIKKLVSKLVARDILLGVWQMHKNNFFHLDIKSENAVVDSKGSSMM